MKMKKWLLGLITFAAMAVLCAVYAGAENFNGFWGYVPQNDSEAYISSYNGFDDKITIPSKIDGYTITGIANDAFYDNDNISDVTIPGTVTYIGLCAFKNSSISSVYIPSSVKELAKGSGLDYGNGRQFEDCYSLRKVTYDTSADIPGYAFSGCMFLNDFKVSNSVKNVGQYAFYDCFFLTEFSSKALTQVDRYAFYNSGLSSVLLPNTLTSIGESSFAETGLKSVNISRSVTSIGDGAFAGCTSLKTVKFDASADVPADAFSGCSSLRTAVIGKKVTDIGYSAFYGCSSLKSVAIYGRVESIGESAFENSSITSINLPDSLTTIGYRAFAGSNLISIEIPSSVTTWLKSYMWQRNDAFVDCEKLKKVYIGENIIDVKNLIFDYDGKFTIYCIPGSDAEYYAKSNGFKYSATLKQIKAKSISFQNKEYTLVVGEAIDLQPLINPGNTTEILKWQSANDNIASISSTGKVYGRSTGVVSVKCSTKSGKKATCTIKVVSNGTTTKDKAVRNISLATISVANQYYTGKAVKPAPTVKYNDITTLQNGRDYTVTYANNVKIGTAKITIKGIGNYTGTVTKTFKITKLPKVSGAKLGGRAADALRVNWTRNASADGYIVEMYKNGKWVRAAKITNKNTTTFRKAGLKASTVYKFRVRAYKMIGSVAAYSDYTATITARTNPSIMKGVKIAGKAKDALRVNWTKNTSAQGYIVEMYKGGKWVRVAKITNSNTTTFRKAGLAKNTAYKFRVRAYHMSGKTALYGNYGSVSGRTLAK